MQNLMRLGLEKTTSATLIREHEGVVRRQRDLSILNGTTSRRAGPSSPTTFAKTPLWFIAEKGRILLTHQLNESCGYCTEGTERHGDGKRFF